MATITDVQCAKWRQKLHRESLSLMQGEATPLTKAEYKAAFQAVEDFWEINRTALKSDIDTAVGRTISNALAKKIGRQWMQSKWRDE